MDALGRGMNCSALSAPRLAAFSGHPSPWRRTTPRWHREKARCWFCDHGTATQRPLRLSDSPNVRWLLVIRSLRFIAPGTASPDPVGGIEDLLHPQVGTALTGPGTR